jgi:hypothetical protein
MLKTTPSITKRYTSSTRFLHCVMPKHMLNFSLTVERAASTPGAYPLLASGSCCEKDGQLVTVRTEGNV